MHVTVLREIPEGAALSGSWNRLVERMEHPEVFFTYQWALAASRAFRATLSPLLFLMHEGDELCGVAALAVPSEKPGSACFLTASTADYCDIVSAPDTRASVLTCLIREVANLKLRALTLASVPSDSLTCKELPVIARALRFHLRSRLAYECGLVEFGSQYQRQTIAHTVTHKSREQRGLKKLSKLGTVRLIHLTRPDETSSSLPQIVVAQVSRFFATNRISPLVGHERRVFLRELTSLVSVAEWLKISELQINGQPVAWNYGFRFGDSWFWYLPSFKIEYDTCSPGSCLLRLLVEEGCADPSLRWLDLGLGDESYKDRFATTTRTTRHIQLSRSLLQHALITCRQLVTTAATRFPNVADLVRRARHSIRSLSLRLHNDGPKSTITRVARRVVRLAASRDEVLFFEATAAGSGDRSNVRLEPMTWENLAKAGVENADDSDTLQYLMRAAARLKNEATEGFVLHDHAANAVHFLSVTNLQKFYAGEIDYTLNFGQSADALIFDCWTPPRYRGLGYYPLAISLATAELRKNASNVWIFCMATNTPSAKGILKAGFTYRFSLVRRRKLGLSTVVRQDKTTALISLSAGGTGSHPGSAVVGNSDRGFGRPELR